LKERRGSIKGKEREHGRKGEGTLKHRSWGMEEHERENERTIQFNS